ncbi:MAG: hypothetical protein OEX07_15195, partial [Gammaproteobacteria bacterium]|nr:hypothetical protein [Gammaproteobacteria bacterium]
MAIRKQSISPTGNHFSKLYNQEIAKLKRRFYEQFSPSNGTYLLFLLAVVWCLSFGSASAAQSPHQNFPSDLSSVECGSCHVNEQQNDLPGNHIPVQSSQNKCGSCHNIVAWASVQFQHDENDPECEKCHDNQIAQGQPIDHPFMQDGCDSCHLTYSWSLTKNSLPDPDSAFFVSGSVFPDSTLSGSSNSISARAPRVLFDHTGLVDNCESCHNGTNARAPAPTHIAVTANTCESCHSTIVWQPVRRVDHNQVVGECISCHNGTIAKAKTVNHINTTDNCGGCHTSLAWRPIPRVNHDEVIGICLDCHTGVI